MNFVNKHSHYTKCESARPGWRHPRLPLTNEQFGSGAASLKTSWESCDQAKLNIFFFEHDVYYGLGNSKNTSPEEARVEEMAKADVPVAPNHAKEMRTLILFHPMCPSINDPSVYGDGGGVPPIPHRPSTAVSEQNFRAQEVTLVFDTSFRPQTYSVAATRLQKDSTATPSPSFRTAAAEDWSNNFTKAHTSGVLLETGSLYPSDVAPGLMTLPFMTIGWFLVLISALVFWRMKVFSTRSSDMSSSGLVAPAASVGGNESVVNFQRALSTLRSFDRINREQGFGSRGAMQRLEMEKADHAEDKPDKGHVSVTLRKWTTTDSELAHRVAEALVSERQLQLPGENSSSIFPPCPSFEQGSHDAHPIDHPNSSWTDAQILAPFASELVAIGDVPMGMRTYNSRQEDTLLLQHPGEPLEMTRHMTSANSSAGPFPRSVSVESFGNWETWWRENTMEMAAILSIYTNFNVKDKMECVMLARSAKIYQRLVVYVYIQMKEFANVHGSRNSLRKALSEWEEWDDLQWLANHHVVRNTLWHMLSTRGVVYPKQVCDIRGILDFDTNVIQKMVMTILNDRKFKKRFLALCQNNPMPVANLFQTLLDQDNLQTKSRSLLARALARLAKSSKCYPDCLILTAIRRTGTDPVAGGGFSDVWKGYFAEETVAMKALRIYKQSVRECVLKEFSHEAVIWRQLRHPNILPFYGVFKGDALFDRLCLISPWMDAGNVNDYLGDHPDSDRLSLLSDVAQGLEYLHLFQPPIIHGDLKGANIFVSPSYTACLGDFGLARFRDSLESTLGATTGNTLGTLRWQAPELLNIGESVRQSEQCDIYSFGCVCLELMTGRPPFSETRNDAAVMMAIAKGQIPQRPLENALERGLDDTLWAWMQQCWNFDPALRPKVVQLVEHFKTHQRESRVATQTVSQLPRASLDQYGFPTHYVSAVSGLTAQENINNVEQV